MPATQTPPQLKRYVLAAAAILAAVVGYVEVLSRRRWTGAAGKPGYQDPFPGHAHHVDKALKGLARRAFL